MQLQSADPGVEAGIISLEITRESLLGFALSQEFIERDLASCKVSLVVTVPNINGKHSATQILRQVDMLLRIFRGHRVHVELVLNAAVQDLFQGWLRLVVEESHEVVVDQVVRCGQADGF